MILFETTLGNITVELFETDAPETTANFRQYVEDSFYDGTIFHRVIDGFMIQGGGFELESTTQEFRLVSPASPSKIRPHPSENSVSPVKQTFWSGRW